VGSLPAWVTSLADVGAELRSGARAVENLAINGAEAIVDLCHAPQQVPRAVVNLAVNGVEAIVDVFQAPQQVRNDPNHMGFGPPPLVDMRCIPSPNNRRAAAINNDVNRAHARGHHKENIVAREKLRVGDWVEVYTKSCQVWCPAQVSDTHAEKVVTVNFRAPGAVEQLKKTLPTSSNELQTELRYSNR